MAYVFCDANALQDCTVYQNSLSLGKPVLPIVGYVQEVTDVFKTSRGIDLSSSLIRLVIVIKLP